MIDLHVHTNHSCDSKVTIEEYSEKAIKIGLKYICFTDHIDLIKQIMDMVIIMLTNSLKILMVPEKNIQTK